MLQGDTMRESIHLTHARARQECLRKMGYPGESRRHGVKRKPKDKEKRN
jgi:hypothetical protein